MTAHSTRQARHTADTASSHQDTRYLGAKASRAVRSTEPKVRDSNPLGPRKRTRWKRRVFLCLPSTTDRSFSRVFLPKRGRSTSGRSPPASPRSQPTFSSGARTTATPHSSTWNDSRMAASASSTPPCRSTARAASCSTSQCQNSNAGSDQVARQPGGHRLVLRRDRREGLSARWPVSLTTTSLLYSGEHGPSTPSS